VIGNRVIVSVGGKGHCVVALRAETGEVEWQALDDAASTSSAVLFAGGARAVGAAPDVVFMTPLRIVALDPLDGKVRWQHPMIFQPQGTSPTPIAVGDRLVASTQAHGALAVKVEEKDDKIDATQSWQVKDAKSYFSSGVASGDRLYLVTNKTEILPSAGISCIDPTAGTTLWTKKNVGYFHAGVIRLGDGKLLVLNDSGTLSLLAVDDKGATELASARVSGGTLSSPALSNGRLFLRDDKELICVQLPGEGSSK
jgi:outer membrane protein assembly factor BamB